jgi:hypothetical protein
MKKGFVVTVLAFLVVPGIEPRAFHVLGKDCMPGHIPGVFNECSDSIDGVWMSREDAGQSSTACHHPVCAT